MPDWPRGPTWWIENNVVHVSVPFTWNLSEVRQILCRGFANGAVVGGPAVQLLPEYLAGIPGVIIGKDHPRVLQRVNPMATRTTTGCPNKCKFCAIGQGRVEPGGFHELADWPDLPIITDNNLFAASPAHFDRVMDRLERWGWL